MKILFFLSLLPPHKCKESFQSLHGVWYCNQLNFEADKLIQ